MSSAWTTKSSGTHKEYVVLKHRLADINGNVAGVKFRCGYAVVEKNSKVYFTLKQLPLLKGQPEYDLLHLRKLKFITRTADVKMVYGQDVYYHYLKQLNPVIEQEEIKREETKDDEHVALYHLCAFTKKTGTKCEHPALDKSPSKYCRVHILEDKGLEALGIKLGKRMTKQEKKAFKESVITKLERLKTPNSQTESL